MVALEPVYYRVATIIFTGSSDLAKLNPKCYMNYSIIFTENSFYLETSDKCYICLFIRHLYAQFVNSVTLEEIFNVQENIYNTCRKWVSISQLLITVGR